MLICFVPIFQCLDWQKIFILSLVTFYSPLLKVYSSQPTLNLQTRLACMGEKVPLLSHTIPDTPRTLDIVHASSVTQFCPTL